MIALGALLKDADLFPIDAFNEAILIAQKPKIAEINTNALKAGADLINN